MTALPVLIALISIFAAGFGLNMILSRTAAKISLVETLAFSWLLGALFISLAMASIGIFFRGLALQWIITLACIALGITGTKILRKRWDRVSWPRPADALEAVFCLALLAQFIAVLCMAFKESLGWDGLLVWEIKARLAFLHDGALPWSYFVDEMTAYTHPEYPLMLPMIETWLYVWIGDCDQFRVRIIFPVFYGTAALVLYAGGSRLSGKRWPGMVAALLLFFVPFALTGLGSALSGYADFPMAVFYLAGMVCFLRYQKEPSVPLAVLFSLLSSALPWMKREGVILWCCLMAISVFEFLRKRNYLAALLVPLPGLALWSGWRIAVKVLKIPPNTEYMPLGFDTVHAHLHRLGPILHTSLHELVNLRDWSLLWVAFAIALPCLAMRAQGRLAAQACLLIVLPFGLYSSVYLLSAWPSYMTHMTLSFPRLLLQLSLVALLTVALAVGAKRGNGVT